jgi:anti-anti-sigma factor
MSKASPRAEQDECTGPGVVMPRTDHHCKHSFDIHGRRASDGRRGVQLCSRPRPPATVIAVSGEVDATNSERVKDYLVGFVHVDHPLVLDLSGVEFLGVAGFRAVIRFAVKCRRAEREWALVDQ